jgi:MFS family permease
LLLFTAFNSADNLAAKVLREDGYKELGFYSMASLYLVFAITGFTSKALVNKLKTPGLGYRLPLFIGGLCYFLRILCFLMPATYGPSHHTLTSVLILVTAALNGFGAGLLWVAQSAYVTSCATASTKGFYFSYFFVIFMVSQIIGNLVAAFLLKYQGQALYYMVMAVLSASGCCMFWVLKAPREEVIETVSRA